MIWVSLDIERLGQKSYGSCVSKLSVKNINN